MHSAYLAYFLLLAASAGAFRVSSVPHRPAGCTADRKNVLQAERAADDDGCAVTRREWIAMIAPATVGASVACTPHAANADDGIGSTSIQLADAIKTMDMGLPSYGSISAPKAKVDVLTNEYEAPKETKERAKANTSAGSDSGNALGAVLPSMNKSGKKTARAEAEPSAPKPKPEKASSGPKYEVVDFSLPSYSGETSSKQKSMFSI